MASFDAVSIKPAKVTDGSWGMRFTATGFTAGGVRLTALIEEAYGFQWDSYRVDGVPPPFHRQQFDIEARMDGEDEAAYAALDIDGRMLLLRQLLRERFKLAVVVEQREREVYLLEVDKKGARLGEALVETEVEKARRDRIRRMQPDSLEVERMSMEGLAGLLRGQVRRVVLDRTGLKGRYAFTLRWTPEGEEATEHPELATALKEQLGLRLVAAKEPIKVVVVSHVEAPLPN